ncbi:MAG: carbohydrate ABC transporter permease, partial [Clostridia bacterium]|nr:carbohydrate ABC transporter permease [Clostridia bacterium]
LLPVYFLVVNSFKEPFEFFENAWKFPKTLYFINYKAAFELGVGQVSIFQMYINSIIYTVATMLIAAAATTVTAYVTARFRFRGRDLLVAIGIGAMLVPDLGGSSTIYKMFVDLHMIDTWFILVKSASPFGIMFLITYSTFRTVSGTYAEAAKLDGASEMRIFLEIMLPMAKGCIGMMCVMSAIGSWNDYYTPYMYMPSVKTLALGLQELSEEAATYSNYTELYAAMVVAVIPMLVLFITMRKTIINNAVAGGLKG